MIAPALAVLETIPWFVPCLLVAAAVSLIAAKRTARRLRTRPILAGLLTLSVGAILAATLTPIARPAEGALVVAGVCEIDRVGLAPLVDLLTVNDTSLNVLLFLPLGLALGLLPASGLKWALVAASFALPITIEGLQMIAPVLARGCQSADVSDNLTGLVVGLSTAILARRSLLPSGARRDPATRN